MGNHRRNFAPQLKQEVVDLLRRSRKPALQVARELGIGQTTLNRWNRQADQMPLGTKGFLATEGCRRIVDGAVGWSRIGSLEIGLHTDNQ